MDSFSMDVKEDDANDDETNPMLEADEHQHHPVMVDDGTIKEEAGVSASPSSKRRFFPRVKHLLTPGWENVRTNLAIMFLHGVLSAINECGAHYVAAASHKGTNPWYKAFHLVYSGVAQDCSVPTGKNRYHKFKDKIIEIWHALEQNVTHKYHDMGYAQLAAYRHASEARKSATVPPVQSPTDNLPKDPTEHHLLMQDQPVNHQYSLDEAPAPPPVPKTASTAAMSPTTAYRMNRPAVPPSSALGKRPHPSSNATQLPNETFELFDETEVLKTLPQPLQNLVSLRHMSAEVQLPDTQMIEDSYQHALNEFLDAQYHNKSSSELFTLCQGLMLLWRLSKRIQKHQESKAILFTYQNVTQQYLATVSRTLTTV